MFGWSQFLFPGCNIALAYTLAAIPLLFHALLYSIMGSSMPRSGGDYVWVSRIAHPALGFTVNWMFIAYLTVAVGSIMSYFSYVGLSQLFWIVGTLQNNSSLLALSQLAATPPWMLGFGILLTIAVAILLQFPTQKVFKLLWVCFIIVLLGWFTIMALLATSSLSDFQAGFLYYTGTSYQNIITSATAAGYSYAPNFGQTIAALPLAFLTYSGYVTIAYAAGEIKQVKKSLLYSIPGSLLFGWVIYSATAVLLDNTVGMQFLGSIGQLVFGSPATEPYTYSYITFIGSVLTRNVFVAGWICIAFIFWIIIIGVTNMFYITRCIFAWSFDRVVPTIFAHMNDRFNTPTYGGTRRSRRIHRRLSPYYIYSHRSIHELWIRHVCRIFDYRYCLRCVSVYQKRDVSKLTFERSYRGGSSLRDNLWSSYCRVLRIADLLDGWKCRPLRAGRGSAMDSRGSEYRLLFCSLLHITSVSHEAGNRHACVRSNRFHLNRTPE